MSRFFVSGFLAIVMSGLASSAFAGNLLIKVDKSAQTLTVIRDGQTLARWPVSTGKTGHATPSGAFTAFRMEADHFSKEWDDAPMPHSVFFTKQGHAIHGSFDVKRLGSPASHGCVRLAPENAAALFGLVQQEGLPNTRVVLTGSEQVALHLQAERKAQKAAGNARFEASTERSQDDIPRARNASIPPPRPSAEQYPFVSSGYAQGRYANTPDTLTQTPLDARRVQRLAPREPYDGARRPYPAGREHGLVYADPYDGTLRYIPR